MDAARPILVGFDARIRRQAVQAQIFGRPVTGEGAGEVDSHAAEAADLLNSRELEFATTERLEDILPIGRVLECDSDPLAQRKSADLVIAIRPPDRIAFELLFFAVRHRQPITAIEFRPENRRRNLPKQLAEHLLPRDLEHLFGRAIEGDEPPIGVEGEEPFRQPVHDLIDRQGRAVRNRARRSDAVRRRTVCAEPRIGRFVYTHEALPPQALRAIGAPPRKDRRVSVLAFLRRVKGARKPGRLEPTSIADQDRISTIARKTRIRARTLRAPTPFYRWRPCSKTTPMQSSRSSLRASPYEARCSRAQSTPVERG